MPISIFLDDPLTLIEGDTGRVEQSTPKKWIFAKVNTFQSHFNPLRSDYW